MKKYSSKKVYFNLNEVKALLFSHSFDCSFEATASIMNEFKSFITGYAPYSIVSDIAANYDYFLEGREHVNELDRILDLKPKHLNDRLHKLSMLSLARSAFWIGFFTNKQQERKLEVEDFIKIMDSIYKRLKYNYHNGFNAFARYLSFLFANRHITIAQISELSSLMTLRSKSLSYRAMLIITLFGTFATSKKDLELTLINFYGSLVQLRDRLIDVVCPVEPKDQEEVSFTNFLFLCKTLEIARYAEMEEAERELSFKDIFREYISKFIKTNPDKASEWFLPLDAHWQDDPKDMITFSKEVGDILGLK